MIEVVVLAVGVLTLAGWLVLGIDAARGRGRILYLRQAPPPSAASRAALPRLSVVFGARNEARGVEAAVRSMLQLDYPKLEVIAVDDRSEDGTGEVLARLAREDSRLRVVRVEEPLPSGWLGKNHALWTGARASTGELILFTDADVMFAPTAAIRAVAWMLDHGVDHVAGATDVRARSLPLQLFVATFALFFNAYFRPWRAADPDSGGYAGFGGFNLVRRRTYERAGTHAAIALDPLDDVNLGRLIKQSGGRQVCAIPGRLARVEWYPSLRDAVRGLEKNTLAGVNWSPGLLLVGIVGQVVVAVWPFLAVVATQGPARWLNLAIVLVLVTLHAAMLSATSLPRWLPLLLPLGVLLLAWTALRAATLTYWRGGIEWRGTFYRLDELRAEHRRR